LYTDARWRIPYLTQKSYKKYTARLLVTVSEKDINKLRKDLKKHDPQPTK
jgi:hypothetical protein